MCFIVDTLNVILLFVNGAIKIMIYHLVTFSYSNILSQLSSLFTNIVNELETFLFSADKIHFLSLFLIILVLVSILFVTIYVVVKILFSFSKKSQETTTNLDNEEKSTDSSEEQMNDEDDTEASTVPSNASFFDQANNTYSSQVKSNTDNESYNQDYKDVVMQKRSNSDINFDWQKQKKEKSFAERENELSFSAIDSRKNIRDLLGMIINMLGRHVDELKIAQAVMYRCNDNLSEETVLQIVLSAKEFLILCQQGAFDNVRRLKDLPSDEDCVLRLIAGDTSYAMALMEALMDEKINQAINMKNMAQRNVLFKNVSNYACYFGTMAEIHDQNLASASFELAVEMDPTNPLAWSRCADLYQKQGLSSKAYWAYKNVLKLSHKGNSVSQEANAHKYLSQCLYDQGEGHQASELYLKSKTYYDSIGINRPLDKQELEIIALMDKTTTNCIVRSVLPKKQHYL